MMTSIFNDESYWRRRFFAEANDTDLTDEQLRAYACNLFDVQSRSDLNPNQWRKLFEDLVKDKIQEWVDSKQGKISWGSRLEDLIDPKTFSRSYRNRITGGKK